MRVRSFMPWPRGVLVVGMLLVMLFAGRTAAAGDIRVMTSGAFTAAYLELVPQCTPASGDTLVTAATSMGTGLAFIPSRLQRGEAADVVIIDDTALRQMVKDGLVMPDSRVALARSGIGMAVRAGAPKPDISSVDALRSTLLKAASIAYSASVSGLYLSTELFQRLGIADQVLAKSRRVEGERVGAVVARGEAEIGFQQISELLPVPGIDYVGPLPPQVQRATVFSAGVVAASKNPSAARALIACLASPEAGRIVTKSGMEPMMGLDVPAAGSPTPPEFEYLGTLHAEIGTRTVVERGPQGTRTIVELVGGRFDGPRVKASLQVPAGDWVTNRADGSLKLDVRFTLRTDDGALILVTYNGIGQTTAAGASLRSARTRHHVRAGVGKPEGDRAANARRATDDDGHLAAEIHEVLFQGATATFTVECARSRRERSPAST